MYVALQHYSTVSFVRVIVVSSAKDCGFDARTVKTKDYTCIYDNGICFFCAKETALRSKSKELLSRTEGPVKIIALNVSNSLYIQFIPSLDFGVFRVIISCSSHPVFSGTRVARSLVFYVICCGSLFVLFPSAIVMSGLRFTAFDYPFGIFKFS